ncbi:MAG: hypothetical protein IKU99_02325, partial [Clostridia bacterium]|nr:hypothetical protein [Clostridia bacterium]
EGSKVYIKGGRFEAKDAYYGKYYVLDVDESYEATAEKKSAFYVTGGTFVKFNPANHTNDGSYTNKVVDGYHSINNNGIYTVGAHTYTSVVTAPTCTAGGYTTYTCACGDSYTADETDALGHSATCPHSTVVDGVYYESIVDALEAAKSGDIITLTQDVDLHEEYLELHVTLDLAGHKLIIAGLFNNGRVVDSALTGSLTVKDGGFTFDGIEYQDDEGNQLQVPVCVARGDDSNTFVFRAPKAQNKDAVETEGKVVIDFRPSFAGGNYTNTDLFGDGSLDNDVKFEIRVTRTGADGTKTVQLPISQELVQKVYSATNRGIRLTVTGAEAEYDYTIELVIYSCGVTVHNTVLATIPAAPVTGDEGNKGDDQE